MGSGRESFILFSGVVPSFQYRYQFTYHQCLATSLSKIHVASQQPILWLISTSNILYCPEARVVTKPLWPSRVGPDAAEHPYRSPLRLEMASP